MKPGDSLPLKDVLDPKPGPLISTVAQAEPLVPIVERDDFGFYGEANIVSTAINSAVGRDRERYPRWVRITAYVLGLLSLVPIILSLTSYIRSFF